MREHTLYRDTGVIEPKDGITWQDDIAYPVSELKGPSAWLVCRLTYERMRDRFCFHERVRNHATIKILWALDTERLRLV